MGGGSLRRREDALNLKQHGIPLGRAVDFDLEHARIEADLREDYGEDGWNALGFLDGQLSNLTFTLRDGFIRVISLRRATRTEGKLCAKGS